MKRLVWIVLLGCGAASSEEPETTQGAETVEATPVEAVVEAPALTDPIDGVSFIEMHALRAPDDPDRWHAIQWEEEHHRYVASRSDDPERKVEIAADEVQSLLNLFEEHRETFTLPVHTSDFLVVRAGFIAMDRAAAEDEPEPTPQEEIDRLNHFSDQWSLLGDVAQGLERENRRLESYRGVRQSMENQNTVCADAESERCQNHRAWSAAYEAVATRFRGIVDSALDAIREV